MATSQTNLHDSNGSSSSSDSSSSSYEEIQDSWDFLQSVAATYDHKMYGKRHNEVSDSVTGPSRLNRQVSLPLSKIYQNTTDCNPTVLVLEHLHACEAQGCPVSTLSKLEPSAMFDIMSSVLKEKGYTPAPSSQLPLSPQ